MTEWEYRKIDLNQLPRKRDDIDLLCEAGTEGWELVVVLTNNIAYLKRAVEEAISPTAEPSKDQSIREVAEENGDASGRTAEMKAKYRDPKTKETWSGRGRMATWLKRKRDAGEDIEDYLV